MPDPVFRGALIDRRSKGLILVTAHQSTAGRLFINQPDGGGLHSRPAWLEESCRAAFGVQPRPIGYAFRPANLSKSKTSRLVKRYTGGTWATREEIFLGGVGVGDCRK